MDLFIYNNKINIDTIFILVKIIEILYFSGRYIPIIDNTNIIIVKNNVPVCVFDIFEFLNVFTDKSTHNDIIVKFNILLTYTFP